MTRLGIALCTLVVLGTFTASAAAQDKTREKPAKASAAAISTVNLNTATQAQLETLPGIGAAGQADHRVPAEERRIQEGGRADECEGHRRKELPETQAAHHRWCGGGPGNREVTVAGPVRWGENRAPDVSRTGQ